MWGGDLVCKIARGGKERGRRSRRTQSLYAPSCCSKDKSKNDRGRKGMGGGGPKNVHRARV
jgi:hypothetical protein